MVLQAPSGPAQTRSQKIPCPSASSGAKFGWNLSSGRVSMNVSSATDRSIINRIFCPSSAKQALEGSRKSVGKHRLHWLGIE